MASDPNSAAEPADIQNLRRHLRILADLARLTGKNPNLERFFDQAAVQVARAVEVDHVKVLRYRPRSRCQPATQVFTGGASDLLRSYAGGVLARLGLRFARTSFPFGFRRGG